MNDDTDKVKEIKPNKLDFLTKKSDLSGNTSDKFHMLMTNYEHKIHN